jgi:multimeric flavodoxin WrbA
VTTARTPLRALALVCTLTASPEPSSSEFMARQVLDELAVNGVEGDLIRVVDHDVRPGVQLDMGGGDEWP